MTEFADCGVLPNHWRELSLEQIARLAPVECLQWPLANAHNIQVLIKREDLLHSALGGNKFYKLYHHLQRFEGSGKNVLASFGGAYSNHIYALAALGRACGIETVGFIRGEKPQRLSPMLSDVVRFGMHLAFLPRADYRALSALPEASVHWQLRYPEAYFIPEGGGDRLGAAGCVSWARAAIELSQEGHNIDPSHVVVAAGTGATVSGVLCAAGGRKTVGILSLKGGEQEHRAFRHKVLTLSETLSQNGELNPVDSPCLVLETDYHCGGYAKFPEYLRDFTTQFYEQTTVPLDRVYTAKLMWGLEKMILKGQVPRGSNVLVLHTGGLQGNRQ